MRNISGITTHIGILVSGFVGIAAAQSSDATTRNESSATETAVASQVPDDSLPGVADTAQPKKGGGLFGKVKGIAKNKVVQQVAKTAACNMLPGGQVVASAIDAAAKKDAAGAAAGAATGTTCMPGMGGAGAMAGGAMTGAAIPGGAGMLAGVAAGGAAGQPTGMDPATMAAYNAQMMAMMQATMARAGQAGQMPAMPGMTIPPGNAAGAPNEAEGRALDVSSDLVGELRKGKTKVRHIDWIAGTSSLSATGSASFAEAITSIASAMRDAGGSYRLDLYMDKRYDKAAVDALGSQRLSMVQMALINAGAGGPAAAPQIGKIRRDGDPRLEIVKAE
jgi:hypothetical protein